MKEVRKMGWLKVPEDVKEEAKEVLCCPECGRIMELFTESVPLFGGIHGAYCDNCDSVFIAEDDVPEEKKKEWKEEE